jgi:hypothetical protein
MVMVNSCQLLVDRKKSFEFREGFRFLVSGFRFPEKKIAFSGAGLRARFTDRDQTAGKARPMKPIFQKPETGNRKLSCYWP